MTQQLQLSWAPPRTDAEHADAGAVPSWIDRFGPELLIALAVAVNVAVVLSARRFPYLDAPNHLARFVLMERYWFGEAPPFITVHLVPTPYILGDLLGVAMVHLFGPTGGMRAFVVLILVALPSGMYRLIRMTAPERRGWALMGALLSFSAFLMQGNLNYALGIGLVFWWLSWWWPRRRDAIWPDRALFAAGAIVLFFVHLASALIVLAVISLDYLLEAAAARSERGGMVAMLRNPRFATVATITLTIAAMWAWATWSSAGMNSAGGAMDFRPPLKKLVAAAYPLYWTSYGQLAALVAIYLGALVTFARTNRRDMRAELFMATTILFGFLYLLFPRNIPTSGRGLDVRWLPVVYLAPFCFVAGARVRAQGTALLVPFVGSLIVAAMAWQTARWVDHDLASFDAILAQIPPETTVLPLVSAVRRGQIDPYWHYPSWHVIRNHGRIPRLFNANYFRDGDPPQLNLRHFVEQKHLFLPPDDWGLPQAPLQPLDWKRIEAEYDYVIAAAHDARTLAYIGSHARQVARAGDVVLYQVIGPGRTAGGSVVAAAAR